MPACVHVHVNCTDLCAEEDEVGGAVLLTLLRLRLGLSTQKAGRDMQPKDGLRHQR